MGLQPGSDSGAVDQVEALVAELLERLANGERDALEALCTAHPEFAGELRVRMSALREMNLVPADAAAMAFPERLGEFRLVRRLGSGGMGVVYEAVQESLGRTVALKLIRPEHLYFERSRERFRRETEAVARLSHPGVVSIYTVGEAQGTPYFAMELIHGATVAQALEQVRGVAPEALV
ncbi:MAG: protein kinase, partial [Planctomycetaceae bacterium]|nr:protein kinase [Planctomycetaceae bacterium]